MNLSADWLNFTMMLVSAMLTLIIFSYIFGDHFLFHLAVALFIGVSAAIGCLTIYHSVLYPALIQPIIQDPIRGWITIAIPLLLSCLLFFKLSQRWSFMGNPSLAIMAGVGAATVVGGAIKGTLFPQIIASITQFDLQEMKAASVNPIVGLIEGGVILFGTITTLAYFHFGAHLTSEGKLQRTSWIEPLSWIGKFFIAVALGWIFSGILRAGYIAFLERVRFMIDLILDLLRVI